MRLLLYILAFLTAGNLGAETDHLEIKWYRDSIEYLLISKFVYSSATESIRDQAGSLDNGVVWAIVLDIDETALDNSPYWLGLAAYKQEFEWPSWNSWVNRRIAQAVPGAPGFITAARELGGRVAFISNRNQDNRPATIGNLEALGMWQEGDLLCLLKDDQDIDKAPRRLQLRSGIGRCSWNGVQVKVLAYVGDAIGDLPAGDEDGGWEGELGYRYFLLPNPMYGGFVDNPTRTFSAE